MTTVTQTADNLYVKQVTIAASASASEVIETGGAVPVSVFTDATSTDPTTTHFKIQACLTADGTFVDAKANGNVIKAEATTAIEAHFPDAVFAPFIRLVAVTSLEAADAQNAARTLKVVLRKYLS